MGFGASYPVGYFSDLNVTGNVTILGGVASRITQVSKSADYSTVLADLGVMFDYTGTFTLTLLAAATAGAGYYVGARNSGTGIITISPVVGGLTKKLYPGQALWVISDGATYKVLSQGGPTYHLCPISIENGGSALEAGIKFDVSIRNANYKIVGWDLLADQAGDLVLDLWKDTYANYPPTNADSICAAAKPTLSAASKGSDTVLTDWTVDLLDGDTLRVNIDSAATIERATLNLLLKKVS